MIEISHLVTDSTESL